MNFVNSNLFAIVISAIQGIGCLILAIWVLSHMKDK